MLSFNLQYHYTSERLANLRKKYSLKVCYKQSLSFLKNQSLISKNLSNRIVIGSNFTKSYKQLKYFYIKLLRSNFIKNENLFKKKYKFIQPDISYFLSSYLQSTSLNDLDRVLIWRASQLNVMFSIRFTEKKKKKKYFYKSRVYFLTPSKRILLVWKWLNAFIRSFLVKNQKYEVALLPSLENFLTAQHNNHIITDMKLQVYKLQLLRTS